MMPEFPDFGVEGCDAGGAASIYYRSDLGKYVCRCLVCARCDKHTGNSNYGHYTKACKNVVGQGLTVKGYIEAIKDIPHHFCCPDDCELENG